LKSGPIDIRKAIDYATQIATGLGAAHNKGIVHRDLKPENIIVTRDGLVKILDFGLAKYHPEPAAGSTSSEAETKHQITEIGAVMGTLAYMSPEQARGQEVDARSDLFGLGVVLHEMLTGEIPFSGPSNADVIAALLEREPASLRESLPEVNRELERILEKLLRKDREARYWSAVALLADLNELRLDLHYEERSVRSGKSVQELQASAISKAEPGQTVPVRIAGSLDASRPALRRYRPGMPLWIGAILITAAAGYLLGTRWTDTGEITSLAILPFSNDSGDPNKEYLSDGLTESIIYNLSKLPQLKVLPRSSVFRFKGKSTDPQEAARELGARAVLLGRVTQRGEDLSISAELIDARENRVLWGEQYNRKLSDALSLQRDISWEISEHLQLRLSGDQARMVTQRYTEDGDAYQAYLRGRYYWNKRTGVSLKRGIEYFQQAVDKDPNYALAWTGLADSWALMPFYTNIPVRDVVSKAKSISTKAIELDPRLGEAHASLGNIKFYFDWDVPGAEQEFRRAIDLNPNYATAYQWYGELLTFSDRPAEADRTLRRALELEPYSLIMNSVLANLQLWKGEYKAAIEQCEKTLAMDPDFPLARRWMAYGLAHQGRYQAAIAEIHKAIGFDGRATTYVSDLACNHAASGHLKQARELLKELLERAESEYVGPLDIGVVHAALGDSELALQWLDRGFQERSPDLFFLKIVPFWKRVLGDPRCRELLRRYGMPPWPGTPISRLADR
ncbi:MAG: protein kinase, partial [Acidobacteria bacterium]|nr:protein kinase [Acidobacteriota bacterium]